MTTAGELSVVVKGQDIGLSALLQKIDAQAQKSADSALRLSQQYARLAQAQGQPALSAQILSGSLQSVAGASESAAVAVQTQLSKIESGKTIFTEFGAAANQSLLSIVGPAALVTTAIGAATEAIRSFSDAFQFKAQLDASTKSIDILLHNTRDMGVTWAGAAKFANEYKLTQQETNEAIQASVRIIRSSKAPIEDVLGAFARLRVLAPEKTFSDASRALSELQAGQVVSIEHLFNVPRRDANEMKKEIEGGGDAVKVLNSYLDRTGISMEAVKAQAEGAAGAIKDQVRAQEQLKVAQAEFAAGPGLTILKGETTGLLSVTGQLVGNFKAVDAANDVFIAKLQETGSITEALAARNATLSVSLQQVGSATDQVTASSLNMDAERREAYAVSAQSADIEQHRVDVLNAAKEAQDAQTQSLIEQIAKKQASQQASQQLTQVETILANIGNAVASGQTTAANGAIQFANAAGIATSQAYKLVAAQAALSNAVPRNIAIGQGIEQNTKRLEAQGDAYKQIRDAQERQVLQTGSAAERQAVLNKQLDRARITYGEQSKQFIEAQTNLKQYQQQQEKSGKRGAGGVKLTDQQKLNNQLLSNQEQYQQKYDDLEVQHEQKRLNILEDYYDKVKQATETFQQDQLEGRASFYDNLGGIENQKIAKAASAAYEQAAVEAGKIAQEKGADVANKYMQAQEQIISARAKRQADIEKAAKDKDKAKAEYLKGVDAQYRAAEDAKLSRIKEGDDSLASQRDKQLADENRAYEEQSGKLADHAEASADRRIAAAQRAGKAIDEEAAKASSLATTYDKIAPAAGPGAAAATTAPTVAADTETPVSAIDTAREAIVSALQAVERAAKETTGAVKQIRMNGGVAG